MDTKTIVSKLKAFVISLNSKGVPIPMLRDPQTGRSSMTATLVFLSFNTALLGQIGKVTKYLGDVDLTQANYLFLLALGGYLGRKMQAGTGDKAVDLAGNEPKAEAPVKEEG